MTRTEWFPNSINPVHPGMYLIRPIAAAPSYWRAFDGTHWHYGIPTIVMPCPDYAVFSKHAILEEDDRFEWCGIVKEENA